MRALLLLTCVLLTGEGFAGTPAAQGRGRGRPCASKGFSCVPGPCCHGLKCDDGIGGGTCQPPEEKEKEPTKKKGG